MSEVNDKPVGPELPLPSQLRVDELTAYVYNHFDHLLNPEESAAQRFQWYAEESLASGDDAKWGAFFKIPDMEKEHPDLLLRIRTDGVALVMAAAAARVVRECGDRIILNRCARCGALCRTPVARQCFACGLDWHEESAR